MNVVMTSAEGRFVEVQGTAEGMAFTAGSSTPCWPWPSSASARSPRCRPSCWTSRPRADDRPPRAGRAPASHRNLGSLFGERGPKGDPTRSRRTAADPPVPAMTGCGWSAPRPTPTRSPRSPPSWATSRPAAPPAGGARRGRGRRHPRGQRPPEGARPSPPRPGSPRWPTTPASRSTPSTARPACRTARYAGEHATVRRERGPAAGRAERRARPTGRPASARW